MSERCEHCGSIIRRSNKSRWKPDPRFDATLIEAAQELGVSRARAYQLVEERWLTVSGRYFGPRAKTSAPGIMYVSRESIAEAAKRPPQRALSTKDKANILHVLHEVGLVGPLAWDFVHYQHRGVGCV